MSGYFARRRRERVFRAALDWGVVLGVAALAALEGGAIALLIIRIHP